MITDKLIATIIAVTAYLIIFYFSYTYWYLDVKNSRFWLAILVSGAWLTVLTSILKFVKKRVNK